MEEAQNGRWHLDKRVPISLIIAILFQTAAAIWFLSDLRHDVDDLVVRTTNMEVRENTRAKNISENSINIAVINQNLLEIQRSLNRIEANQRQEGKK